MTYAVFPAGGGGSGDVQGPITSVDNGVVLFNGTSGKVIKDLGVGSANQVLKTDGSAPSFGLIVNANIDGSAGIELSKLAAMTASRALVSNGSGFVSASAVTSTELGYLSGVTSSIQTQLNTNAADIATNASDILDRVLKAGDTMTGQLIINTTSNQLQLRTGTNALTVNAGTSAAARTYTVPDGGTIANFVIDQGASTFNGARTFKAKSVHEAGVQIGITGASYSIGFVAPAADRTINLQDPGGTANFVLSEGTQTLGGTYTFSNTITGDISGNAGTVTNGVYTSRTLTAGDGLSGGGDLSADRSFAVDSTVVRTSGAQTIAGVKTFSDHVVVNASISTNISNASLYNVLGGDISVFSGSGNSSVTIAAGVSSQSSLLFADGDTGDARRAGRISYNHSTDSFDFFTNGNNFRASLDSAGNFGIGTPSPAGGISGTERFVAVENSNVAGISFDTTGGVTNTKWSVYTLNSTGAFNIRNVDGAVTAFSATPSGAVTLGASGTTPAHSLNTLAASSATAGTIQPPAQVSGYITMIINGTSRRIPYYNT